MTCCPKKKVGKTHDATGCFFPQNRQAQNWDLLHLLFHRPGDEDSVKITLPETNIPPLKWMEAPSPESPEFQGAPIFRGENASFREGSPLGVFQSTCDTDNGFIGFPSSKKSIVIGITLD